MNSLPGHHQQLAVAPLIMDAWAYYLKKAAVAKAKAKATQAAARATAEGEAAMTLLQMSSGANPPGEPQEEPRPVAVAGSQIIVPQADSQEHVVSGATAGALLPIMPAGHLSAAAAPHKSTKRKLVVPVPHAAKKPTVIKKRRLHDIHAQLQLQAAQEPAPRMPLPLPASWLRFACSRCDLKFSSFQALGGHMAGHSRANNNKYDTQGQLALDRALQSIHGVPRANTDAGSSSGLKERVIHPPPPTAPVIKNLIASSRMAHKLRAEERADIDAAAASAPAAPRGQPRDFDLNEMPSDEE